MKRFFKIVFSLLLLCCFLSFKNSSEIYFEIPEGWETPHYDFKNNKLTEEKLTLGRQLFYDPILSRDSTISCASCHLQATGFTHVDHDVSHGIEGKVGTRNSLVLMNLAWSKTFMWDGGVNHLDVQALSPITNPVEMDETLENVVRKLQKSENYQKLFSEAYGTNTVTGQKVLKSISQFLVMLTTSNSKYDKVQRGEEVFTAQEENGYRLFKQNCASCHTEPLFTNNGYENNGLKPDPYFMDMGRMAITRKIEDSLKFKVPTLRNVQFTYPYMHDGRFATLTEVIKHYNSGIHHTTTLSNKLATPMKLTSNDRVDLVAFLKTLTDKEFLYNPDFSYPRGNY
ncbi:cytochrome-c peroxidase [Flavobacterium arcticum]|uniref:Cytochrome-c peroxidase n=1 Tax=Flavobacterium arcticum TaxID=1784713 RepID=A0A345HCQ4_9FLAO|nr:cytochrome c peroxidase [Flavobacterium arcticum]AXG74364.1 cytochrome-c peroxidase [Flavobacterium arcticum]KAF2507521.1 c-type cytochrome [Flavobacterium arcticum]